jgi:hypothetical protein
MLGKFMLTFLQNGIFSLLIFTIISSCADNKEGTKEKSTNTNNDVLLNRALVNGYYTQLTDNIGLSAYNNKIYLLTGAENGFSEDVFLFHLVKRDHTFSNKDFKRDEYLISDSLFNKFKSLSVIQLPMNRVEFNEIRIGQYSRQEDLKTKNIWVNQISAKEIQARNSRYKNQFEDFINKNLINGSFKLSLQFGVFFKNNQGFNILYGDGFIYIISEQNIATEDKFMLHFIDKENKFVNQSFNINEQRFQDQLEPPYSNLNITRIPLPNEPFIQIRIGQFNSSGNIWAQQFSLEDILGNPLLKYNNEFQNYKP